MTTLRDKAETGLTWATLLFLLPLAPVLGSAASIAASVAAILLVPFVARRDGVARIRRELALLAFLTVFAALAACFAITARAPRDVLFAFNFVSLPLAAVVYLAVGRREPAEQWVRTIAIVCLAGVLAALAIALNDIYLRGLQYVYGFNMGPHVIARLALVMGFVSLAGLFATTSPWRYVFHAGPLAGCLVTYLAGTRGAALAIPLLVLVAASMFLTDRRQRLQSVVLLAVVGVVALVPLVLGAGRIASIAPVVGSVLSSGATGDGATSERLAMLSAAWQLFLASPIVGHGWANFAAVGYPILQATVWGGPTDPFFQFHNDLANFAVAAGIVGVICWVALLAAPVLGALMSPRDALFRVRLYCCVQLSVSYFVFGLTDFTLGYDLPTTLYAFLTAIVLGAFRESPSNAPAPTEQTRPAT